jgi:hypothetical protein
MQLAAITQTRRGKILIYNFHKLLLRQGARKLVRDLHTPHITVFTGKQLRMAREYRPQAADARSERS